MFIKMFVMEETRLLLLLLNGKKQPFLEMLKGVSMNPAVPKVLKLFASR